ncbi:MAG: YbdK family carboxylate-amine ligase [Gammaproteobacteria bacterium]|nr:MAG: YbdK family carboxylate-amine ligase [Gammaproteobacteria bacterium]
MKFQGSPAPTLGVEVELQLLNARTLDLEDGILPLLERFRDEPRVKPEFNQCTVELNSRLCRNAAEAEADLVPLLEALKEACGDLGMVLAGAGTHPFCQRLSAITPNPRYLFMAEKMGYLGHLLMTFAEHIHVGMPSGDEAVSVMARMKAYIPLLTALSANSPFWQGFDTGYACYRRRVLASMKSYGIPPSFPRWEAFADFFERTRRAHVFKTLRDIHWDLRPRPDFGTLEVRVMDVQPDLRRTFAIAAFVHALVVHVQRSLREGDELLPRQHWWFEKENDFRATLRGLEAHYILDNGERCLPIRTLIEETLARIAPIAEELGASAHLRGIGEILQAPGYALQKEAYAKRKDFREVAAFLVKAWEKGLRSLPARS